MRTLLLVVAAGVVAGAVAGGELHGLRTVRLRWLPALWAGLVLHVTPRLVDVGEDAASVATLAGAVLLVAVGLANLRLVGMPVVVVGLALNLTVVAANGGTMPVRAAAVAAVAGSSADDVRTDDIGGSHRLAEPGDRLTVLGDALPVRPLGEVVSFGDLIVAAGLADVVFRLLRPPHRRPSPSVAWPVAAPRRRPA